MGIGSSKEYTFLKLYVNSKCQGLANCVIGKQTFSTGSVFSEQTYSEQTESV